MSETTWVFFEKNAKIFKYKLIDNEHLFNVNLMQLQIEGWNEELTFNDITHIRTFDYLKDKIDTLPTSLKELNIKKSNINVIPIFNDKIEQIKIINSKIDNNEDNISSLKMMYPKAKIDIYNNEFMFKTNYVRKYEPVVRLVRQVGIGFVPFERNYRNLNNIIDDTKNVLNSQQTVHLSSINKCVIDAIEFIKKESGKYDVVSVPIDKLLSVMPGNYAGTFTIMLHILNRVYKNKVIDNYNKYSKLKKSLNRWYNDGNIHSVFQLTFRELFDMIMKIIENHPEKNNIKELMIAELYDAIGLCFLGRINRMINSLAPFVDGIKISISTKEEIQIKIGLIIKKLMDNKIKKKDAFIKMKELFNDVGEKDNITDDFKNSNLEALNDFDDDDEEMEMKELSNGHDDIGGKENITKVDE